MDNTNPLPLANLAKAFANALPPKMRENLKKVRIAQNLLDRIAGGEWEVGDQLPSIEDLAEEYRVSTGTIIEARTYLVQQGILRAEQGVGTFVEHIPQEEPDEDDPIEALKEARDAIDRAIAAVQKKRGSHDRT